jgi:hypothetical protein
MYAAMTLGHCPDLPIAACRLRRRLDGACGTQVRALVERVRVVLIIGTGDTCWYWKMIKRTVDNSEVASSGYWCNGYKKYIIHMYLREMSK